MLYNKIFEQAHKDGAEQFGIGWVDANKAAIEVAEDFEIDISESRRKALLSQLTLTVLKSQQFKYLILSGEGGFRTEHSFLMECDTLEEANEEFEKFKSDEYKDTELFIYKALRVKNG